jgi:hypothetical protein
MIEENIEEKLREVICGNDVYIKRETLTIIEIILIKN